VPAFGDLRGYPCVHQAPEFQQFFMYVVGGALDVALMIMGRQNRFLPGFLPGKIRQFHQNEEHNLSGNY